MSIDEKNKLKTKVCIYLCLCSYLDDGVVVGGHGDTGGQEAHAGAGHDVDLVGPDIVIQGRVLGTIIFVIVSVII